MVADGQWAVGIDFPAVPITEGIAAEVFGPKSRVYSAANFANNNLDRDTCV